MFTELRKCESCGGELISHAEAGFWKCKYCGTKYYLKEQKGETLIHALNRAGELRQRSDFEGAIVEYTAILKTYPKDEEANWGMFIARCGIEYVKDDRTGNMIPTCHRVVKGDVFKDPYCQAAIQNATPEQAALYREQTKEISALQKKIKQQMDGEEDYEVFISFKAKDEKGYPTKDAVVARNIYDKLTAHGIKTFFSEVTLAKRMGEDFEPIIYKALYSCQYFILVTTSEAHTEAVWVKNEWARFRDRMQEEYMTQCAFAVFSGKDCIPHFMHGMQGFDLEKYPNGGYEIAVADFLALKLGKTKQAYEPQMPKTAPQKPVKKKRALPVILSVCALLLAAAIGFGVLTVLNQGEETSSLPDESTETTDRSETTDHSETTDRSETGDTVDTDDTDDTDEETDTETEETKASDWVVTVTAEGQVAYSEYTSDGFHVNASGWREAFPWVQVQTRDRVDLKQGLYLEVVIDHFTYMNDKWFNFDVWESPNFQPAGAPDGSSGVQTLIRPTDAATGHGTVSEVQWYYEQFTASETTSFEKDKNLTTADGKPILRLTLTWNGASYALDINGAAAPKAVINFMNEKWGGKDSFAYFGFVMQNNNVGGHAEFTVTKVGTSAENAVTPTEPGVVDFVKEELSYTLLGNGKEYDVSGIGAVRDTAIEIPATYRDIPVTGIGNFAFVDCNQLTDVTIPDSITYIGQHAFRGCNGLTKIALGKGVKTIDAYAFQSCGALASITIPQSVTKINDGAFDGCPALTEIIFEGTKEQWNSISKHEYWISGNTSYTVHCTDGDIGK